MNDLVIETNDLTKCYGEQVCVAQLCLHVPKGKIYALLGRNGAGKTTTMKMLLNLVKPTSGFIKIFNDIHLEDASKAYSRIGALIETPGFYDNLTGRENLEIIARLRGLNSIESVDQALSVVNLDKNDKKIFEKYSLGMKQRLGIAAAIMHKPEILILDEPMNGLDPIGIYEMREYLVNLCKEGNTTVFISSHILSEIEQIADVIGVMNHGRLLEEESITDLHKRLRRYAEYEVSNVEYVFSLLKERLDVSEILIDSKNRIRLFGKEMHRIEEINSYLIQNSIPIRQIRIEEEKLEDYFSELIGGGEIG